MESAGASIATWTFARSITDDDIINVRALVLRGESYPCDKTGGILFTVEEMGEREMAGWKRYWGEGVMHKDEWDTDVNIAIKKMGFAL